MKPLWILFNLHIRKSDYSMSWLQLRRKMSLRLSWSLRTARLNLQLQSRSQISQWHSKSNQRSKLRKNQYRILTLTLRKILICLSLTICPRHHETWTEEASEIILTKNYLKIRDWVMSSKNHLRILLLIIWKLATLIKLLNHWMILISGRVLIWMILLVAETILQILTQVVAR